MNIHDCELIEIDGEMIEVDKKCVEAVKFFNEVGLKTRFCCENQKGRFTIIFDNDNPNDEYMLNFIKNYSIPTEGLFGIWVRHFPKDGVLNNKCDLKLTWKFECNPSDSDIIIKIMKNKYYNTNNI